MDIDRLFLAIGAIMGSSLSHYDPLDFCPATKAIQPGALIYHEIILEITPAIDPINTGSIPRDAVGENLPDAIQQSIGLRRVERSRSGQWVNSRMEQGFVSINVAQTGYETLVQ